MGESTSECGTHGCKCGVASSRFHSSGLSCKDLSKLNKARSSHGRVSLSQGTGTSGQTLTGLLNGLKSHNFDILVLENVDDLHSTASNNYEYLVNALKQRGYESYSGEFQSNQYGMPTRRLRVYVVQSSG